MQSGPTLSIVVPVFNEEAILDTLHARVVAELFKVAGVSADYLALDERQRVLLLRHELGSERLLASPYASYSPETLSELDIVRAAALVSLPRAPAIGPAGETFRPFLSAASRR